MQNDRQDQKQNPPKSQPAKPEAPAVSQSRTNLLFSPLSLFALIVVAFCVTLTLYATILERPEPGQAAGTRVAVKAAVPPAEQASLRQPGRPVAAVPQNRYEITEIPGHPPATVPQPGERADPGRTARGRVARRQLTPEESARKQKIKSLTREIFEQLKRDETITPDTLHLKSGRVIHGTIVGDRGDHWKTRVGGVTATVAKSDVERIERKPPRDVDRELRRLALEQAIRIVDEGLVRHGDDWITPEEREIRMRAAQTKLEIEKLEAQRAFAAKPPRRSSQLPPQRSSIRADGGVDFSSVVVVEGRGFGDIVLGHRLCTKQFIKTRLGPPDFEKEHVLDYNVKYGLELSMASDADMLIAIHLNRSFKGRLGSGISLSSTIEDVFAAYGEPIAEEHAGSLNLDYREYNDSVLYRDGPTGRLTYRNFGLMFWFTDSEIAQIVVGRI